MKSEGRDEREFSLKSLEQKNVTQNMHKKVEENNGKQTGIGVFQQGKKHLEEFGVCCA